MVYGLLNRRRGGLKMNIDKVSLSKQYWNLDEESTIERFE